MYACLQQAFQTLVRTCTHAHAQMYTAGYCNTSLTHPHAPTLTPACAYMDHHCSKDVSPGNGRIAACLDKRILETKEGNVVGRKVDKKCLKELGKCMK